MTDEVLARASRAFPVEPVRTLDALHLATVELLGEPPAMVTVVTRDERVAGQRARHRTRSRVDRRRGGHMDTPVRPCYRTPSR